MKIICVIPNKSMYLACAGLLAFLISTAASSQTVKPVVSCESIAKMAFPDTTITSAQAYAAGEYKMPNARGGGQGAPGGQGGQQQPQGQGAPAGQGGQAAPAAQGGQAGGGGGRAPQPAPSFPAFCRITATLTPSIDSSIKIEVVLPTENWNGKYMAAGSGGWGGSVSETSLLDPLQQGFAASATDTGHGGNGGEFIIGHPEKLIDYAYRADHQMVVISKAFIKAFYGKAATQSDWVGCSLGGLEGLIEAKRYPEDFDGIAVGSPPNPITAFNAAQIWPAWLIMQEPDRFIATSKFSVIHDAAVKACATPVGLKQGFIEDPESCKFDPITIQCKGADAPDCLTAPQVDLMRQIYAGPTNPRTHEVIFTGLPRGSEDTLSFYAQKDGPFSGALDLFRYAAFHDANWDWRSFDFDKVLADGEKEVGPVMNVDGNLNPFLNRGGKLLMYIGGMEYKSYGHMQEYYHDVLKNAGPSKEDSVRLFLLPGMGHCGGGPGSDQFDKLGAISSWVTSNKAPDQLLSSKVSGGKTIRTRPICAYPALAKYDGKGDMDDAKSFVCSK